jgi:ADP-ribose pyrophosphatase YjhB (NUDIX family)
MRIITSAVIIENDRLLMVQEGNPKCYEQWWLPAGHVDENEDVLAGTIREAKEETGCDVKLTGLLRIVSAADINAIFFFFTAKVMGGGH